MNSILKADLHIHSVLSACASLEMSPSAIIERACQEELDVIAITDHNSSGNCRVAHDIGQEKDIIVLSGMEVTVQEEFHVVVLFSDPDKADTLDLIIRRSLLPIEIDEERMGYQLVVDRDENVLSFEKQVLNQASLPIDELVEKVQELDGFLFFSHIDKAYASIVANLGFIPPEYKDFTFEIVGADDYGVQKVVKNSDAHFLKDVGHRYTIIKAEKKMQSVFSALKKGDFYYDA